MFCPKCGSQNADETKFCRGCGAALGNVLAALNTSGTSLAGKRGKNPPADAGGSASERSFAEKQIELYGSGLRGVMIGAGFFITASLAFGISIRLSVLGIFLLAFAFYFLGTGISRLIQIRAMKALRNPEADTTNKALPPDQTEYIKPTQSIYDTDDLIARPLSVTEYTTRHLKKDSDDETFVSPEK